MPPSDDPSLSIASLASDQAAVLGAVGQVRECLAAARNLEHLVSSINIGPKVILQVLPDVAELLETFPSAVSGLLSTLGERVRLSSDERQEITRIGESQLSRLVGLVRQLPGERMQARQRLELERQLRDTVPFVVSAVSHCELLVEAASAAPVCLSMAELFSGGPERGSDRPVRRVPVAGDLESAVSRIPPRTALLALAAFVCQEVDQVGAGPMLLVSRASADEGSVVRVSRASSEPVSCTATLPVFFPHAVTRSVVGAALGVHGGAWTETELLLPGPGRLES